jgi:uncharacterized protein
MKYVLFYEPTDNLLEKARLHFPAHQAYWTKFLTEGTLLMIGTFANPQEEGAMGIFTTRKAAEKFAKNDPFVLNGVVKKWYIREWNEVLMKIAG